MAITDRLLEELTGDAAVRQVVVGAMLSAVVIDRPEPRCGLAASMVSSLSHHPYGAPVVRDAGRLTRQSARQLAGLVASASAVEAGIGMAAVNALLEVDEDACSQVNAAELIVERGRGRSVAVVGHFPFVDRVRAAAGRCWVLERKPLPGDEPAERAAEFLPEADVVALSGTTLLNQTFDQLIEWCRPEAFVLLVGASAPLLPLLFDRGVDVIAGAQVVDVAAAVAAASQGAGFRQLPGRRLLTLTKASATSGSAPPAPA